MQNYTPNLVKIVKQIKDGRKNRGKRYSVEVIVWIVILGLLLGESTFIDIYDLFVYNKKIRKIICKITGKKLRQIPHPTTISRVLKKIDLKQVLESINFDRCITEIGKQLEVAGDGKVMRGIHNGSKRQILSLVSQELFPLYQIEISEKENEITALVNLLKNDKVNFSQETLLTFDAIQTQTSVIKELQKKKLNYFLKVKSNQKKLRDELSYIFRQGLTDTTFPLKAQSHQEFEKAHDRETKWKIVSSTDFDSRDLPAGFESVKTIGFIQTTSKRPIYKNYSGKKHYKTTAHRTFFISSTIKTPQEFLRISRNHWRIEKLHWLKDNIYLEDRHTLKGKAAYFFTFLKSVSINLINRLSSKISKTIRRLKFDYFFLTKSLKQLGIM